jgi:hypothetical protein
MSLQDAEPARVAKEIRRVIDAIKASVKRRGQGRDGRPAGAEGSAGGAAGGHEGAGALLHPSMADVYRRKVTDLATGLESEDVEVREPARSEIRARITTIVIPEGNKKMQVTRNLGEMLAIAAIGRDRSTQAAVAHNGCGGSQPLWATAMYRVAS